MSAAETAIQNKDGQDALLKQADSLDLPLGWTLPSDIDTKDAWSFSVSVTTKVVGLAISVLAVSLGAPFWFDVLSKIINIRAASKPRPASANLHRRRLDRRYSKDEQIIGRFDTTSSIADRAIFAAGNSSSLLAVLFL